MSTDTPSTPGDTRSSLATGRGRRLLTESEDAIRNLKASESVQSAFIAAGFPSPPNDVTAIISNHVRSAIQGLPLSQVANMSPGSGVLANAAVTGVNQFVSSLTPSQREAVKAGVNPLDPSAMMKLAAGMRGELAGLGRIGGRDAGHSGARYEALGSASLTPSQLQARDIAVKNGLGWAANNAELLAMGPSAMQALADVHLRQESFERFKQGGLTERTIVAGARWAKKNGVDYNEFSSAYHATQGQLGEGDRKEHNRAVERYFTAPGATEAERETAKKEFNDKMDEIKKRNPSAASQIENEQRILNTQKNREQQAKVKAETSVATARTAKSENDATLASLNTPATGAAAPAATKSDAAKPKQRSASAPKPPGT